MKKIIKDNDEIQSYLKEKKKQLEVIANSDYPKGYKLESVHDRRVANSKKFLNELDIIERDFLGWGLNVQLVSNITTFKKLLSEADLVDTQLNGKFCTVVLIHSYPSELWLIYTKPLSSLTIQEWFHSLFLNKKL